MKLWSFETKNFRVMCNTFDEPFRAPYMDADLADECRAKTKSGEWKCFTVEVTVLHKPTGAMLANEYLGQCIHANRKEFRDHVGINEKSRRDGRAYGSYFSQMVREACSAARIELKELRTEEIAKAEKLGRGRVK